MRVSSQYPEEHQVLPEEVRITIALGLQELKRLADSQTLGEHLEATGLERQVVVEKLSRLNWVAQRVPTLNNVASDQWSDDQWRDAAHIMRSLAPVAHSSPATAGVVPSATYHPAADHPDVMDYSEHLITELVANENAPRWQRIMLADLLGCLAACQAEEVSYEDPDYVWWRSMASLIALDISICQQMDRLSGLPEGNLSVSTFAALGRPGCDHMLRSALLMYGARRYHQFLMDATTLKLD